MKMLRGAALILVLGATAGCQGFPLNFAGHDRVTPATADVSSYFAQVIEEGRRHLAAHRPAAAVTAYRRASYHPQYAGEAYNGMAIAYDQLGRYDLAERFFNQARSAAPQDERFARNAARFETAMLARRESASAQALAAATPAAQIRATDIMLAQLPQSIERSAETAPEGQLQRVSSREVRIPSRGNQPPRIAVAPSARPAVLHIGSRRDAGDRPNDAGDHYPARVELASVPVVRDAVLRGDLADGTQSRFADARGAVRVSVSGPVRRRVRPGYPIQVQLEPAS